MSAPEQVRDPYAGRERREAWVLDSQMAPSLATAYACGNDGGVAYWWVPSIGYSVPEADIFADEKQARASALQRLRKERARLDGRIRELEASS